MSEREVSMGLQADIGMEPITANVVQRFMQRVGATRLGTAVFSKVMSPLDRILHKASWGRLTAGRSFGALSVVLLTTTGARTGLERTTPINAIPIEGDLALVATNYGSGTTPGWAHNLLGNPGASITYENQIYGVVARAVTDDEYEAVFSAAIRIYPGYANYRRNATNEIHVFVLGGRGKR